MTAFVRSWPGTQGFSALRLFCASHMLCRRTAFPASGLVCPPQNPLRWRIQPDKGFLGSPTSSDFLRLCPMWLILLGFVGLSDHCPWPPTSSDCVRCGDSLIRFLASDGPPPFRSYIILYVNGDGVGRVDTPHCTGAPVPNGPPVPNMDFRHDSHVVPARFPSRLTGATHTWAGRVRGGWQVSLVKLYFGLV